MTTTTSRPPWWPTAETKAHADAGCAHPVKCNLLTKANTKVIVCPVVHESHGRVTRRTWSAAVVLKTDATDGGDPNGRTVCGHYMHPTIEAASTCGVKVWRLLP